MFSNEEVKGEFAVLLAPEYSFVLIVDSYCDITSTRLIYIDSYWMTYDVLKGMDSTLFTLLSLKPIGVILPS